MSESSTAASDEAEQGVHDKRWPALAVCLGAGAMTLLDLSIVNVALPSMRDGLDAGAATIQWVVAGYALAYGVLLVPAGRLGDARSRRTVFIAGVVLFTLASAACGAALSPFMLGAARVAQGIGGGLIAPQVSAFIQSMFRGPERARAFGLFGLTVSLSTAVGPVLGGLLVGLGGPDLGWRLVFYVNVPVGIALIVAALRYLPTVAAGDKRSLDPVGVLLFTVATFVVLLPLVDERGGGSLAERPWWLLGVAGGIYLVLAWWERRWRSRGHETLIEPALLRIRSYLLGLGVGTAFFAGFTSIFLVLTLYLQEGLGYSALEAGLTQVPFALGSAISAIGAGRIVSRFGRIVVVVGLVMASIGLVLTDAVVPLLDGDEGLKLAPLLFLTGFGAGAVISPNITLVLNDVDPRMGGVGGGLLQTSQRIGSAVGVAVITAIYFAAMAAHGSDHGAAFAAALRVTIGFVVVALVLALLDLGRRRVNLSDFADE